ncbi:ribosomal protein [Trichosporon asahii var. asahii CBS 8904]|uniref:Ribosomal protein n=1 Tax=Trichosporon asahii var. asahii (strain CBS 8904) TaxID=1220162 RepID=K1VHE8_TRIAC|nr:ribosomal protein [Trichosporon asahii var. asahii CBS 8904]
MQSQQQPSTFKRFVEVGRVVLVNDGPSAGKLAVIAEIIDHNRALIDGPATGVPRQQFPYRHLILTPYTLAKLPRAAGSGAVKKAFEKSGVEDKWASSAWAKKLAAREARKLSFRTMVADSQATTDFDRFQIMIAKKQRRGLARKAYAKERKANA